MSWKAAQTPVRLNLSSKLPELIKQFQLLHASITVEADRSDLDQVIAFTIQDAGQRLPVMSETTIAVQTHKNGYRITQDGHTFQIGESQWDLAYGLLSLFHKQAFRDVRDHIRVHAACADYQGARFIVMGEKGAGKTTLMLKLLLTQNGFQVGGDEMVLIDGKGAMPFPRRFHVKSGYSTLFKELRPSIEASPKFMVAPSRWLYGFSPAEAGFRWNIDHKPIKAIYFLTPNHNGRTLVQKCSGLEMLKHIMPLSYLSTSNDQLKIPRLCRLVADVASYHLSIGDLDGAVAVIRGHLAC